MPPFTSRKRAASPEKDITSAPPIKKARKKVESSIIPKTLRKPTLFDELDASPWKKQKRSGKEVLNQLIQNNDDAASSSMSSSDEFEEVPIVKGCEIDQVSNTEDENIDFEDVQTHGVNSNPPAGDLELTLTKDTRISVTNSFGTNKAPSKIERQIRTSTHKCHVQTLLWHNAIRNSWLCDIELHQILLHQLPERIKQHIEKWKQDSGISSDVLVEKNLNQRIKSEKKENSKKNQRNWGQSTKRLAEGQVNMSAGDPLFRLLQILVQYWRQKFKIITPGLRKIGYMSLQKIDEELKSFNKDEHDPLRHGEYFQDLGDYKERAKVLQGSRDFGAQLFTALLRAIGLKTRMVASLQPIGFGWNKTEDAAENMNRKNMINGSQIDESSSDLPAEKSSDDSKLHPRNKKKSKTKNLSQNPVISSSKKSSKRPRPTNSPKNLKDLSESELSSLSDDESIVSSTNSQVFTSVPQFDKDLKYPHYWSEVLSPVTNTYVPVDAVVTHIVATNRELVEKFEPRPSKFENVKQVIAYVIGHSSDGTAKDLTTRYLRGKIWPGKTKAYRFPPEKIAIRDRDGKIERYIQRDWFKTLISLYERGSEKYPYDEADEYENATELVPIKRGKKEVEEGKETLQYYKTSSEYILERHLKRDEALKPNAKHVKFFISGKGNNVIKEKVFLRKDIVTCKSAETWHKEGRAPKPNEEPLKRVPYRAATTSRRRKLAEAEEAIGGKVLQGLFSHTQTEWIIPDPIKDGIIPKNSFGNIDLYVDSMLPKGAVHIPFRGIPKICRRLGFDFAEAVTGFEFGNRIAVPIVTGVVVAKENYDAIMEEWHKEEVERVRKEDHKRIKAVLHMWRKLLLSQRVIKRLRDEYQDADEGVHDLNSFIGKRGVSSEDGDIMTKKMVTDHVDENLPGGFLAEGVDVEEAEMIQHVGFFPVANESENENEDYGEGSFIVESHDTLLVSKSKMSRSPAPRSSNSLEIHVESEKEINQEKKINKKRRSQRKSKAKSENSIKPNTKIEFNEETPNEIESAAVPEQIIGETNKITVEKTKRVPHQSRPETRRRLSSRKAAQKSAQAVKSHYFEQSIKNVEEK